MTRIRRDRTTKSTRFFTGLFFTGGLFILVLIGISLGKETYRKRQIQAEIGSLQADIQKMKQENTDLGNLISYLSTQDFQEKEAREKLNLQKEDEKLIVLRKEVDAKNVTQDNASIKGDLSAADESPNWQKWLRYFFEEN